MSDLNELDFEGMEPIELPVKYNGKSYLLREASADAAKEYNSARLRGMEMTFDEAGNKTAKHFDAAGEVEILLVSRCLWAEGKDGNFTLPVKREDVRLWRSKVVKKLHDEAKRISDLDEKEELPELEKQLTTLQAKVAKLKAKEEREKNVSTATETSSPSP